MEANLLITFDPVHEGSAKAEIEALLKEAGVKAKVLEASEGLAMVNVAKPREAISKVAALKEKFKYTFYWWPVDVWCKSGIQEMKAAIKKLQTSIKPEERWKMDLAKRKTVKEYPKDLIIQLTDVVDKPKVDLKNPEKIIKVEIIGDKAAVALIKPNELLKK